MLRVGTRARVGTQKSELWNFRDVLDLRAEAAAASRESPARRPGRAGHRARRVRGDGNGDA